MRTTSRWRSGSADPKLVVAVLFAAVGLSLGAYSIAGAAKPDRSSETAEKVLGSSVDDEGNLVEPVYTKTGSSSKLSDAADVVSSEVGAQAQRVLGSMDLGSLGIEGASAAQIASSVTSTIVPIIGGDQSAFFDAILAMGGKLPGDLDTEDPLFKHLTKVFKDAAIDLTRITVRKHVPEQRGAQMEVTNDEDVRADGSGRRTNQSVMEMQPKSLFPDAPGSSDPTAIEVRVPMKPKGEEHESVLSLILTWNRKARRWQPAAYRMIRTIVTEGGEP